MFSSSAVSGQTPFPAGLVSSVPAVPWEHQPSGGTAKHGCAVLSAEDICEPCTQDSTVLSQLKELVFTLVFVAFFPFLSFSFWSLPTAPESFRVHIEAG